MLPSIMPRRGYPVPAPSMWYAAPDWITLTCRRSDNETAIYRTYEHVGRSVAHWLGENLGSEERQSINGYEGRAIGPVFWGAGYNGVCLQVSGAGAAQVRYHNPPWDNVARLDVQVTLWYEEDYPDVALHVARKSKSVADSAAHRPWKVKHFSGYGDGDTAYIGRRKSARFFRAYDKWRESGEKEEWRHAWRFEVEYKDGTGCALWEGTRATVPDADYWAAIAVRDWAARGIRLPQVLPSAMAPEERIPKGETTNEKRLRWLACQVAPSIQRLRKGGIPLAEIAKALTGSEEPANIIALSYLLDSSQE